MISFIAQFFSRAVMQGTPLLFGATGEIITEKSGNLNLGIPGIMYIGAISGVIGGFFYQNSVAFVNTFVAILITLLCSLAGSLIASLIYCFLTVTLRANQNVTGLALTIFGAGVANFFGGSLNRLAGGVGQISVAKTSALFRTKIFDFLPLPDVVKQMFFSYGFLVYFAILVAVAVWFFLTKTSAGLNLRAVGENPATADAAGINVTRNKYLATCIGTGITGFGGLYFVMDYISGTWANDNTIENLGWLAVALVIFATWKPLRSIWGSYLFGIFFWAYLLFAENLTRRSQELIRMLPYLVTIVVLIVVSLRKKKEDQPPEALGLSYFREDR